MFYLLWTLFNVAISIFFLVLCFRAGRFIRKEVGIFATIIFTIGILSLLASSNMSRDNIDPVSNRAKTWSFNTMDSLDMSVYQDVYIQKTWISKYRLSIAFGKDKQSNIKKPISAYTVVTGFQSGTSWMPLSIAIHPTNNNQEFEYQVVGIIKWKLFGLTLYSQSKTMNGIVLV